MRKTALLLLSASFLQLSCEKNQEEVTQTCFKGRYLDEGCWPIIQVLEPLDARLNNASWSTRYSIYDHAVGVGTIPEKYKDGKTFYFTVARIISDPVHTMECATTGYFAIIKSYSDSACITSPQ